jgi:hypothetical protein
MTMQAGICLLNGRDVVKRDWFFISSTLHLSDILVTDHFDAPSLRSMLLKISCLHVVVDPSYWECLLSYFTLRYLGYTALTPWIMSQSY